MSDSHSLKYRKWQSVRSVHKSAGILQKVHGQKETRQVIIGKTALRVEPNRFLGLAELTEPYIDAMTGEMCYTMSKMLPDKNPRSIRFGQREELLNFGARAQVNFVINWCGNYLICIGHLKI